MGDAIWLGEASFRISAVIVNEPDRGSGFSSFSPRVMIRESDLPATELIQPASRVTYRLLVAGPARRGDVGAPADVKGAVPGETAAQAALRRFVRDSEPAVEKLRGVRVETLDQGRPGNARHARPRCLVPAPGGLARPPCSRPWPSLWSRVTSPNDVWTTVP